MRRDQRWVHHTPVSLAFTILTNISFCCHSVQLNTSSATSDRKQTNNTRISSFPKVLAFHSSEQQKYWKVNIPVPLLRNKHGKDVVTTERTSIFSRYKDFNYCRIWFVAISVTKTTTEDDNCKPSSQHYTRGANFSHTQNSLTLRSEGRLTVQKDGGALTL